MTTPEPPIPQPEATPSPLADWGTRAVGAIIDWLPAAILSAVFSRAGFLSFIAWAVSVAYWAWIGHLDGLTGQSPGKAIMGIRLVNEKGELIGSGPGIGRKFAHIVDFLICGLGFLLPLVDAKRQTIADKLLQTYVVTGAEKKQFSVDLWMPPKQSGAE
jgi:uncharacterized RDD family membrane protein YckC